MNGNSVSSEGQDRLERNKSESNRTKPLKQSIFLTKSFTAAGDIHRMQAGSRHVSLSTRPVPQLT